MFCIKCGKPAVAGNFCERCFLERNRLFEMEDFTTDFCRQCGTFRRGPVEEQIKSKVKTKNKITSCEVKTKHAGNRLIASVSCSGRIEPLQKLVTEERKVTVTVKNRTCENCVKISGNYHEAVFQVRGAHAGRIMNKLEKMLPKESIVAVNTLKEGYNILVTDKRVASRVVSVLQEGFDIKASYKLVGQKKGKKLYRNVYAIR